VWYNIYVNNLQKQDLGGIKILLTAKEARQLVEDSISKEREKELERIEKAINNALESNQFCCDIDGNISAHAKAKLKELGYNVQYLGDEREQFTRIEW